MVQGGGRSAGSPPASRSEQAAQRIRDLIGSGVFRPGEHLNEARLSADLDVSRNTLREAYRILTHEGLIQYETNKGVRVTVPSRASMTDLYRVRRLVEVNILRNAGPDHPAARRMRTAVTRAYAARDQQDWLGVGTANLDFHRSVIALADSPRLERLNELIWVELRLVFGIIDDPRVLHAPYIEMNDTIVGAYEAGQPERAAQLLEEYLLHSEGTMLAAYGRVSDP